MKCALSMTKETNSRGIWSVTNSGISIILINWFRQDEERLQEIQYNRQMEIMKENEIKNLKRLDRMNAAEIEKRKQDYQSEQVLERIMAEDLKYRYYVYNNWSKTSIWIKINWILFYFLLI